MPVRKASFAICVGVLCSTLYLALYYITSSINNAVKQPYMDEIFHIPQARSYCQGNFTYYDPKLTTPPGLYLLTYVRIWLRDRVLLHKSTLICDTLDLRRTNHLMAIFNLVTLVLIQLVADNRGKLVGRKIGFRQRVFHTLNSSTPHDLAKILMNSAAIVLLPPLFFFNSLYYTDAGSLLFTLLVYFCAMIDHHLLASLFGIVSISFRQTNIVWVFYTTCQVILRTFGEHQYRYQDQGGNSKGNSTRVSFFDLVRNREFLGKLLCRCSPYAFVGFLFVSFVYMNEGIALGDREAHQPRLHLAQCLYFLGFCAIFGAPWIFQPRILRRFLYFTIRSPLTTVIATALIIWLTSTGRYAHPYLLADNRHITFYIWRRILDRHNSYVPYMLTPIYLLTSFSVWHHMRARGCKSLMLYIICTMLVTVPNGLLEPRYFIIPFILLRLNAETGLICLLIEIVQFIVINCSMHYLFLHKTFRWADSSEIQRIMW